MCVCVTSTIICFVQLNAANKQTKPHWQAIKTFVLYISRNISTGKRHLEFYISIWYIKINIRPSLKLLHTIRILIFSTCQKHVSHFPRGFFSTAFFIKISWKQKIYAKTSIFHESETQQRNFSNFFFIFYSLKKFKIEEDHIQWFFFFVN